MGARGEGEQKLNSDRTRGFFSCFFSFQKKKCTDSEVRGIIFDTIPPRGQLFCN